MSRSLPQHPHNTSPNVDDTESALDRRAFLGVAGGTLISCLFLQACAGDATGPDGIVEPPPTGSTTFNNGVVTVQLSLIPALTAVNGHQVLGLADGNRRADLTIINVGGTYRAFTSICTHEGCTVSGYSNGRMICPCHGSEFNQNGQPVGGPAPSALREYAVTFNSTAQTLTIAV